MIRRIGVIVVASVALGVLGWRLLPGRHTSGRVVEGLGAATPARLAEVENGFRALEDGERETPRDTWDPDYVVTMAGRDPDRLFAWVRDNTVWIPYHGELRGPVGVLMDRQGNSLDRALLLATLLEKAGHRVRLAHGELSPDQARTLLPGLMARRAEAFPPAGPLAPLSRAGLEAAAARYQLNGAATARHTEARAAALARVWSELRARVTDQTERLLHDIGSPDPNAEWGRRYDHAVESLRDHWWVQRQADRDWLDMDPVATDSGPALTVATETLALDAVAAAPLHQDIAIRVITEQWTPGRLTERTAMERVIRPSEAIGKPVVLQFWPMEWVEDSARGVRTPVGFQTAAPDHKAWIASLLVGTRVDSTVGLLETGDDPNAAVKGGVFGGFGSALTATLEDSGGRHAARIRKTLSAVWIEYEIRVPGEAPRTVRRTVFDLIGPAARHDAPPTALAMDSAQRLARGYGLLMQTEILPLSCRFSPEFLNHLVATSLVGNREVVHALMRGTLVSGSAAADSIIGSGAPAVSPLYTLAAARMEWSSDAHLVYIDRPDILTRHVYPRQGGAGIYLSDATDIVANDVGVSLAAVDGIRARLSQGVLDTNAESLLRMGAAVSGNSGDAYAVSKSWRTMTPADGSVPARVTLPADVRRRMELELGAGRVVLAPDAAVTMPGTEPFTGWWSIDPSTGQALGFSGNGWGDSEDGLLNTIARLMGNKYIQALSRFISAFSVDYTWCLVAITVEEGDTKTPRMAIKAGISASWHECAGQAILIGLYSAVAPLVAIAAEASSVARSRGPQGPPPVKPHEPPAPPKRTGPGTHDPGLDNTQPDLRNTNYDKDCHTPKVPDVLPTPENLAQAKANVEYWSETYRDLNSRELAATSEWLEYRNQFKPDRFSEMDVIHEQSLKRKWQELEPASTRAAVQSRQAKETVVEMQAQIDRANQQAARDRLNQEIGDAKTQGASCDLPGDKTQIGFSGLDGNGAVVP